MRWIKIALSDGQFDLLFFGIGSARELLHQTQVDDAMLEQNWRVVEDMKLFEYMDSSE